MVENRKILTTNDLDGFDKVISNNFRWMNIQIRFIQGVLLQTLKTDHFEA